MYSFNDETLVRYPIHYGNKIIEKSLNPCIIFPFYNYM